MGGDDIIYDDVGENRLIFDDVAPGDIAHVTRGEWYIYDVIITLDSGQTLTIYDQLYRPSIASIKFENGVEWADDELAERVWVIGTDGDDDLTGYYGTDRIRGGLGDDHLDGGWGDDSYYYRFGDGNDVIGDSSGINRLVLEDINPKGIDSIARGGVNGNDIVIKFMGTEDDITLVDQINYSYFQSPSISTLQFADGTEWRGDELVERIWITGTVGDDVLSGDHDFNDRIRGGLGDDLLYGKGGDDCYYYHVGDGNDVIDDSFGVNRLVLEGVDPDGVESVEIGGEFGDDVVITFKATDEIITIVNQRQIESITTLKFSNGTEWGSDEIARRIWINGSDGNDYLLGHYGPDNISGGSGDDVLNGQGGDDDYYYVLGGGNEEVHDSSGNDRLFLGGVSPSDIYDVCRGVVNANDVTITFSSTEESVVLVDQISRYNPSINTIVFSTGLEWTAEELEDRIWITGTDGDDYLKGYDGSDRIRGGVGDDYLEGGRWSDNYYYRLGDGNDVIFDKNGADRLFLEDALPSDIDVVSQGMSYGEYNKDVRIVFSDTGESILLLNQLSLNGGVNAILFSDGTEWLAEDLVSRLWVMGTDGDDYINNDNTSPYSTKSVRGGLGNDLLSGIGDDDYYYRLGDGNDVIRDVLGSNRLFLEDVFSSDVDVGRAGAFGRDATITFSSTGETITIDGQFSTSGRGTSLDTIVFSDGLEWSTEDLEARVWIAGTDGDDALSGYKSSDRIRGGIGDDYLEGKRGDDSYYYRIGDGSDVIDAGFGINRLILEDIREGGVSIWKNGEDVAIAIDGTNDVIVLRNQVRPAFMADDETYNWSISEVEFFGGIVWDSEYLLDLAMNDENTVPVLRVDEGFSVKSGNSLVISQSDLLDNDYDPEGDNINLISTVSSKNGWVEVGDNGDVVFTPSLSVSGHGSFYYHVSDGRGMASSMKVSVEILAPSLDYSTLPFDEGGVSLVGTDESDNIHAGRDVDKILGGKGDDYIVGGRHDNIYYYRKGDGDDVIHDSHGENKLVLVDFVPEDVLHVSKAGDDRESLKISFESSEGSVHIKGLLDVEFSDGSLWTSEMLGERAWIVGGNDSDDIDGGLEGERYRAGRGDDVLNGRGGDDHYYYRLGDGNDVIDDGSGSNRIFLEDILVSDVEKVVRDGGDNNDDVRIVFSSTGEGISIVSQLDYSPGIDLVVFADGSEWTPEDIKDSVFAAWTDGDDDLKGSYSSDRIYGGLGDDRLDGGVGDDSYYYRLGGGNDVITDGSGDDSLVFEDIFSDDIESVEVAGNYGRDAKIVFSSTEDSVTLVDQFSHRQAVDDITFADGIIWRQNDLENMLSPDTGYA